MARLACRPPALKLPEAGDVPTIVIWTKSEAGPAMIVRVLALLLCATIPATAQDAPRASDSSNVPQRRHSIGSSLFLLGNLAQRDPPHFFLLNYGYEMTRRSVVFAEAITWTYYEPLGT